MLILGGIVGFVFSFLLIALPVASTMATQLGVAVIPVIGTFISFVVAPIWNISIFFGVLLHAIVSLICYWVAASAVAGSGSGAMPDGRAVARTPAGGPLAGWEHVELFFRGVMIGTNAAINFLVLPFLPAWLFLGQPVILAALVVALPVLWVLSTIVMMVNLMTLDEGLCADPFFEAVLGYLNWVMPTSFVINAIGLVFVIIDIVAAWPFGVRLRFAFEWWIGVITVHGGVTHPTLFGGDKTAFNTGSFIFVHPVFEEQTPVAEQDLGDRNFWTADGLLFHESGHTMNVAAFGSWWHLVGAIDERIRGIQARQAFAEMLAESHMHAASAPWFPLWGGPGGVAAGTANAPATVARIDPMLGTVPTSTFSASSAATLTADGLDDPDGFPLLLADPGVNPAFGILWKITPADPNQDFSIDDPNATPAVLTLLSGGDYRIDFLITDGLEGSSKTKTVSVVEARANGPYEGAVGTPVQLLATGSTGGSAGRLPSVTAPGVPVMTLNWTLVAGPTPTAVGTFDNAAAEEPTFTGDQAGDYTIRLQVTESAGGVSSIAETLVRLV
jgi:hypothetical protein